MGQEVSLVGALRRMSEKMLCSVTLFPPVKANHRGARKCQGWNGAKSGLSQDLQNFSLEVQQICHFGMNMEEFSRYL